MSESKKKNSEIYRDDNELVKCVEFSNKIIYSYTK